MKNLMKQFCGSEVIETVGQSYEEGPGDYISEQVLQEDDAKEEVVAPSSKRYVKEDNSANLYASLAVISSNF